MPTGFCPECDADISVGPAPKKGQRVTCRKCGAYLMVASESPIELDWADDEEDLDFLEYEEDEDFDFDEDSDEF
jgi:hypothetical protein